VILKAAILLIYLGPISLVIFASSLTSALGQSGCGPGTTLIPATNECVPATVKCGAGTILNAATNQCDLATTSQMTQPNATTSQMTQPNATTSQMTQPTSQMTQPNATTSQMTQPNATTSQMTQPNATTSQMTQPNATDTGIVSNATAGTTVTTGGASNQCKGDDVSLGNLCIPRGCTELLNSFAMNLRDLTQEQVFKQCAEEGLISK
jgi:cell wall-associated NlpC family hydrolase